MPAYASHVQRMTTGSATERRAGLDDMMSLLDDLSEEQLLEVVREPGLLAALNAFLSGDSSLVALKVLYALMGKDSDPGSPTLKLCNVAIFDSPCFLSIKGIAASGSTLELKHTAWTAIKAVARMEEGRSREFFYSAGMVALLRAGIESVASVIAKNASATIQNLSWDVSTASAIFNSLCFPALKDIAETGNTPEIKQNAWEVIKGVSGMGEGRSRKSGWLRRS